jgi:hypothetical protein
MWHGSGTQSADWPPDRPADAGRGAVSWGFGWSRLSELNRRPIHYEGSPCRAGSPRILIWPSPTVRIRPGASGSGSPRCHSVSHPAYDHDRTRLRRQLEVSLVSCSDGYPSTRVDHAWTTKPKSGADRLLRRHHRPSAVQTCEDARRW